MSRLLAVAALLLALGRPYSAPAADPSAATREILRARLEAPVGADGLEASGRRLQCVASLRRFYEARSFQPAWFGTGTAGSMIDSLLVAVEAAADDGLQPEDYHLQAIRALRDAGLRPNPEPAETADADLVLTDAWLLLASHLLSGKLDPATLDPAWVAARRQLDLVPILADAVRERSVIAALARLRPEDPGYGRLKAGLRRYRALAEAGGWQALAPGPPLRSGDRGIRVEALAARLAAEGAAVPQGDVFGPQLDETVRDFQKRCGLAADGIVGPATRDALNVTAAARAACIRTNLERWRWLPQALGDPYIVVNVADYRLRVVRHGATVLTLPVIAGKPFRRTPVFSASLTYLVFSPAWEVPPTLAVQDKLPLIRRDPGYLAAQDITVLQGWGADERIVDPDTVRWDELGPRRFPYHLRQAPGPKNALGGVKFMFPNKFNVYLHDTPSRELFGRAVRTFSSGCIRVQHAEQLASLLLDGDARWTAEAIKEAMTSGREQTVRLPAPLPIHLLYWTAWADSTGTIEFRDDVYGRDARVLAELREPPPGVGR